MKKSLAIIMSLSLVATAAFAQDAAVAATATTAAKTVAAPVATFGFNTTFEANVISDAASNTFEQDAVSKPVSSFNPMGLKAKKFVVSPWVNLDWSKMSVKAEAVYNAFDANLTDYSKINLTTTWKDFFGLEIKSVVSKDNKGIKDATVATPGNATIGTANTTTPFDHDVYITYDRTKENGIKLYTKNNAADFFNIASVVTTGSSLKGLVDNFKELGFALDTADFASSVVFKVNQKVYGTATAPTTLAALTADQLVSAKAAAYNKAFASAISAGKTTALADADGVAAAALVTGVAVLDTDIYANRFDTAWFEARKMFGGWTARFNDSTEMALRVKDLDSKVTIGRSGYGIGKGNNILGGIKTDADLNDAKVDAAGNVVTHNSQLVYLRDMNMLNTITPVKGLTVKAAVVLPTQANVAMVDWLAGENLALGAEYEIDGIGTIGAGALISKDYVANGTGTLQGPSLLLRKIGVAAAPNADVVTRGFNAYSATGLVADYLAVINSNTVTAAAHTAVGGNAAMADLPTYQKNLSAYLGSLAMTAAKASTYTSWDSSFWLDANLSKMVGKDNSLFVSLDSQFGSYVDGAAMAKTIAKADATKPYTFEMASMSKWAIGAEAGIKATDALKLSAAAMFKMGVGYDNKTATNVAWSDVAANKLVLDNTDKSRFVASNYNEANVLAYTMYEIKPLELNVRADYTVNKTASVYLSNGFNLNAGDLKAGILSDKTPITTLVGAKPMYGFYSKNTIGLGTKLAATAKSSLTISGDYNLYLGVPSASDLYAEGANAAAKATLDAAYGTWKSSNFNPFAVKVAYSYAY